MKPESQFEVNLAVVAPLCGCKYIKIPDTRMINQNNRKTHREDKRPFDAIICTPGWNWCVECKINYTKLKPHQKEMQDRINQINKRFLVLRQIFTKVSYYYRIESMFGTYKTTELKDIFKFCKLRHYKGDFHEDEL